MKKTFACLVILAFVFVATVQAQPTDKETFFRDRIKQKIVKCEKKSELIGSKGKNLNAAGERARELMIFLQNNRESLIDEMERREIPANQAKVEFFLIKMYSDQSNLAGR